MSSGNQSTSRKRLDSWKEIAAFFGRDERTVNRWEKELGLPIHRLPGAKGRVYAYADELAAWSAGPRSAGLPPPASSAGPTTAANSASATVAGVAELRTQASAPPQRSTARYRNLVGVPAAAILCSIAVALVLFRPGGSHGSRDQGGFPSSPSTLVRASTPSHNPDAEQLYLKGRYYWDKRTPEDLKKALDYFMQAVVHDPNYAPAYSGLADCYSLLREYSMMPSSEAYPRALAAARKAVELDEQSSEAHASLGFVSFFGMWDVAGGEQEFRRAIELNPNNASAHHWYANALLALERLPEALAEIDKAQTLDPASSSILADKANLLATAGRQEEALSVLREMEQRDPSFPSIHLYLKYIYFRSRDYPDFLSEGRKDAQLMHDPPGLAIATAAEKGFASGGERGMFEGMLRVQKKLYAQRSVSPMALASTYALLGQKAEALQYLQAAYEQRDGALVFVETFPEFGILRKEPRYRDLLVRMNLPADRAASQSKPD